ncbi:MAG: WD40/YVTN/BNR-like repeat-containing protein [Pyrinomonadaceae bacterium]
MPSRIARSFCFLLAALLLFSSLASPETSSAAVTPENLYSALKWRCIGPHRGGRVLAVSGVRGDPNTFYFGAVAGGVWKTTDAGRTWIPIFDSQPVASIGALAVSLSSPNVIYVGTGEADMRSDISYGAGVYKSTDAGQNWSFLGLADTRQIGRVLVDPRDPNIVLVAALGHGFGPNTERGVFRSTDGGKNWTKVLYKDENTGAIDLAYDPDNSRTVYATLWNTRRPAYSTYAPITGPGGGLYKSVDAGVTWRELTGHGLPSVQLGRIGVDVVAGMRGRRVYALIDAKDSSGLYRSDDGGENWSLVSTDPRILSRGWYFGEVRSDPKNPDVVYASNVSLYRSTDAGKTFKAIRGAPGGDDYHSLWIDPEDNRRIVSGVDQGTIVTVNGGKTWSTWYNQPTAQFYHVAVDNQFPYWVYGAQQDSGTAAVISRSDYGQITFRDWHPIGAGESGYILPDPVDPQIVYGGSTGGELYRFDRKTGQVEDVSPTPAEIGMKVRHRYPWTTPMAFSPKPPHALYQASQFLMKTSDAGKSWNIISPDLTLRSGEKEDGARGVIYTIAPSSLAAGTIWIGTDNGLVQITRDDGKTWSEVSPPGLAPWSMISLIDASPHDAETAYAAVDRHQMDDIRPYIYRTRDFGKTWTSIMNGIPENAYVHAVREDPVRKGLLFAGTELGVYVSFDDGESWQSLQLNLPVSPIRDLVVKGNDLVVGTHGRSFWILDDISPLRELNSRIAGESVHLFRPATAIRMRKNESHDTPFQPEMPAGKNPPAGAIIDYSLNSVPSLVILEMFDSSGNLVRRYSSADQVPKPDETQAFPTYWFNPPAPPSTKTGLNRFVWDLRYESPKALRYGYSIAAVYGEDIIMVPEGPLVVPGTYQVKLIVDGRSYTAPLEVRIDPRVRVESAALTKQLALQMKINEGMNQSFEAVQQVRTLRSQLAQLQDKLKSDPNAGVILDAIASLDKKAAELVAVEQQWPPVGVVSAASLNGALGSLAQLVGGADSAPTVQAFEAFDIYSVMLGQQLAKWSALKATELPALNELLRQRRIATITIKN